MTNGRILIVESDLIVAWDLEESLELAGYEVSCVSNGVAALREARKLHPELVIVDFELTRPLDLAGLVQLIHEERRSSVVCLTALADWERPAWLAGALPLTFLGKPIDPRALLVATADGIAAYRTRRRASLSPVPPKLAQKYLCSPARETTLVSVTP